MDTEPLNRITKPAFKTLFGPVGPDGNLLIPSSDNSKSYFEHSVNNNTSLEKTAEFLEELEIVSDKSLSVEMFLIRLIYLNTFKSKQNFFEKKNH